MLPLVTVIVPCYNHEKYVETCLDSIFRQTYKNIEVIVIDDFSPDNSAQIVEELNKKYDFKFIKHAENWGLTKTLNDAIYNHANGKYIKCIASDDYLTNDCIELSAKTLFELGDDYSFVYGLSRTFSVNSYGEKFNGNIIGKHIQGFNQLYFCNQISAPTVLFNREYFIRVKGFDVGLYIEDYYMWLKLASNYKFQFIDKVLAFYNIANINSLSKNHVKMLVANAKLRIDAFINNNDKLSVEDLEKSLKISFGSYYYRLFNEAYLINKWVALKIFACNFISMTSYYKFAILRCIIKLLFPTKFLFALKNICQKYL